MDYGELFRVEPGRPAGIGGRDSGAAPGVDGKKEAKKLLGETVERLDELQYLLYAEGGRSALVVFQAMDAGGKDGTIRRVLGPLNPQGVKVTSFKAPTDEELAHDFLWRIHKAAPRRGEIGVFNRSHYEDVLVVRVHELVPEEVWRSRYDRINEFEGTLSEGGTHMLKFFLHISPVEQLDRFRKRLDKPHKLWKFNPDDLEERKLWDKYMEAYEEALTRCSTEWAPWYVIPADRKWFRNLAVARIIAETLEGLGMEFPEATVDPAEVVLE
jgi:PPK2 family polyphosphate:nucleotide phosphotransferase